MKTKSTFRLSESRGNLFTLPSVRKVDEVNVRKVSEAKGQKSPHLGQRPR